MDSSVVLYGQPSNFLIDRQRDDPTKDKSQSNLGTPSQVEYCPSFILTIIDNGVLNGDNEVLNVGYGTDRVEARGRR